MGAMMTGMMMEMETSGTPGPLPLLFPLPGTSPPPQPCRHTHTHTPPHHAHMPPLCPHTSPGWHLASVYHSPPPRAFPDLPSSYCSSPLLPSISPFALFPNVPSSVDLLHRLSPQETATSRGHTPEPTHWSPESSTVPGSC